MAPGARSRGSAAAAAAAPRACAGEGDALALCHLAQGSASSLVFDDGDGRERLVRAGAGWAYGEDVAGKPGWNSCGGGDEITFALSCAAGDLVVGFLESHDRRMGVVNVTVAQARDATRSLQFSAWDRR